VTEPARGGRTRTRLDPEIRREQIVDAAERVFTLRDPSEVTLEEIAEQAGVSRALVHNYFGDRSGVLAAVHLRCTLQLDEALRSISSDPDGTLDDHLAALVDAYLRIAAANPAAWKLVGTPEATLHPLVVEARRRRCERLADWWGGDAPARLLARSVLGCLDAAVAAWLEQPDLSRDQAVGVIHGLLLRGLAGILTQGSASPTRAVGDPPR
jgi:AcrR family transcriptional regulator